MNIHYPGMVIWDIIGTLQAEKRRADNLLCILALHKKLEITERQNNLYSLYIVSDLNILFKQSEVRSS